MRCLFHFRWQGLIIEAEKELGVAILNGYGSFDGGGVSDHF
jgi:hypothetical protein